MLDVILEAVFLPCLLNISFSSAADGCECEMFDDDDLGDRSLLKRTLLFAGEEIAADLAVESAELSVLSVATANSLPFSSN